MDEFTVEQISRELLWGPELCLHEQLTVEPNHPVLARARRHILVSIFGQPNGHDALSWHMDPTKDFILCASGWLRENSGKVDPVQKANIFAGISVLLDPTTEHLLYSDLPPPAKIHCAITFAREAWRRAQEEQRRFRMTVA